MSNEHLGECAMNCRAYAKALHYKEEEFRQGPTSKILASLIRYESVPSLTITFWSKGQCISINAIQMLVDVT